MAVLKKHSEAWKLAVRISKRKGVNRVPVSLSDDGKTVTFQSGIRGNTWTRNVDELRLICGSKKAGS